MGFISRVAREPQGTDAAQRPAVGVISRHGDVSPCFTQPQASAALHKVTQPIGKLGQCVQYEQVNLKEVTGSDPPTHSHPTLNTRTIYCNRLHSWSESW